MKKYNPGAHELVLLNNRLVKFLAWSENGGCYVNDGAYGTVSYVQQKDIKTLQEWEEPQDSRHTALEGP